MKYYRRKKRDRTANYKDQQPCWTCQNACSGCSWSREFKPIKGWIAIPTVLACHDTEKTSYKIVYCPQYKAEDLT